MREYYITMDQLGRIQIPSEIIAENSIRAKDTVTFVLEEHAIKIVVHCDVCRLCGALIYGKRKYKLCDNCIEVVRSEKNIEIGNVKFSISRRVDELGRIVVPIEYRRALGMDENTELLLKNEDNVIYLCSDNISCIVCGETISYSQKYHMCDKCQSIIREEGN